MGLVKIPGASFGFAADGGTLTVTTFNIDAANDRLGYRFVLNLAKTLSSITVYCSSVTGAPIAADAVCEIYAAGADGNPTGAALASVVAAGAPAVGEIVFSGFGLALTAGTAYWAVFKNVNASPAANFYRLLHPTASAIPSGISGQAGNAGWAVSTSTDGGGTWSSVAAGAVGMVLAFSDLSVTGWLHSAVTTTPVGDGIYATRKQALRLTTPAGCSMNVLGVCFPTVAKTGSPTGFLLATLRAAADDSVLGTSFQFSCNTPPGNSQWVALFGSPIVIPPSSDIRIAIQESAQADASGNRYNLRTMDLTTAGRTVVPHSARYSYYDGANWTDDAGRILPVSLILDEVPFTAVAAAGGGRSPGLFGYGF
ncbi:MAG: hypothetical protein HUU06_01390 [Planctomycetaceae bacterium]|nr:hypothetical protein [Planctomycetaceae bacterium]